VSWRFLGANPNRAINLWPPKLFNIQQGRTTAVHPTCIPVSSRRASGKRSATTELDVDSCGFPLAGSTFSFFQTSEIKKTNGVVIQLSSFSCSLRIPVLVPVLSHGDRFDSTRKSTLWRDTFHFLSESSCSTTRTSGEVRCGALDHLSRVLILIEWSLFWSPVIDITVLTA
jgi:hypothetical protein